VPLACLAVAVLAWVGVLARNHELAKDAAVRGFFAAEVSGADRERDIERLGDAQFLDPNAYWRVALANYLVRDGDTRRAAQEAERLVRDEPENIFAWSALLQATRESDPARAEQAAAEIRRLNPLGSR
jgi:predicted Zn-dependent protease